jgi:aromatic-L-amino-acid/L-tryptophan decarboxylase
LQPPFGLVSKVEVTEPKAQTGRSEDLGAAAVVSWWRELLGFPEGSGGLLVSGAAMANLTGLAAARDARAGFDVRRFGLRGGAGGRLMFYASAETHPTVCRALELLGIGHHCLRRVPAGEDGGIDLAELRDFVARDRARGDRPAVVIGNARAEGLDDLSGLAALCRSERLWLHVDGALGVLAALSSRLRPLVSGLQEADSLAFDLREWMPIPFGAGCVLVRRENDLQSAFAAEEPSCGSHALDVWRSMMIQGVEKHVRVLERKVEEGRLGGTNGLSRRWWRH